jgi:hypothetical protein
MNQLSAHEATNQDPPPADAAIDAELVSPQGAPCESCGYPVEPLDTYCPACGAPQAEPGPDVADAPEQRFFRCDNCGSEVATDPDKRSYACAFCDSTYVVEFSPETSQREPPEFVIGFAVTREQAEEKFHNWIGKNSWFRPGDLRSAMMADKLQGVYLPFWAFSMLAESRWSASIGEYWYRTETYTTKDSKGNTVTRTRRVRETEWWPLSGNHHRYYSGFLVSGSRGLSQQDAERIKPFQLPALKRYRPFFLAGWLCEEYSVPRNDALRICQDEFRNREQQHVAAFMPGDTHRSLQVGTQFRDINSDLCLLPIYILSYRYKDKVYRFLVNGQTGRCAGDKPLSWLRIGITIAAVVIGLGVIGLIFAALNA